MIYLLLAAVTLNGSMKSFIMDNVPFGLMLGRALFDLLDALPEAGWL